MGVGGGVEDDAGGLGLARLLNPIDEVALAVRLAELDREPVPARRLAAQRLDIRQGCAAVFLRLAGTEQVQVGAVDHVDDVRHRSRMAAAGPIDRYALKHDPEKLQTFRKDHALNHDPEKRSGRFNPFWWSGPSRQGATPLHILCYFMIRRDHLPLASVTFFPAHI